MKMEDRRWKIEERRDKKVSKVRKEKLEKNSI